jgi:uncharacterized membrane protein
MESKAKLFGHPVHPILIPFPLGLLGTAVFFDLIAMFNDSDNLARAAYYMIGAGIITGLLAAVPGPSIGVRFHRERGRSVLVWFTAWATLSSLSSSRWPGCCAGTNRRILPAS